MSTLEQTVAELSEQQVTIAADVDAARVMAAGADHDGSLLGVELRAHRQLLNALRETQRSHSGRFDTIETRLDLIETRLDRMEESTAAGFATMRAGMNQIVALLTERPA